MKKPILLAALLSFSPVFAAAPQPLARSVVYQLVFRTFTREGTIAAAMPLLDHVRETGVDIVYLSPFVLMDADANRAGWSRRQIASGFDTPKNPYRIEDYDAIDPEYGTEAELKAFVARAHELGLRVVFDLVYLHCGPNNVIRREIPDAFETNPDGSVRETQWHFAYVNFKSPAVREYLWANMTRFVREFDCDGFRCDVGDAVPIDFWAEGFRRCRELKRDLVTINEGDRPEWLEKGFQAGYSWTISNPIRDKIRGIDPTPFSARQREMAAYAAKLPPQSMSFVFMENHDMANDDGENRFDRVLPVGAGNAGFVAEFLMRGVSVIHNGNEIADRSLSSFFAPVGHPLRAKYTVDWSRALTADGRSRLALLRRLAEIRHTHPCFGDAKMEYLETSEPERVLAFRRTAADGRRAVVAVNLSKESCTVALPGGLAAELVSAGAEKTPDGRIRLSPYGYLAAELRACADVVLSNACGRAVIERRGARVVSYVPAGGSEVLARLESGAGGIPLCWPWFQFNGPAPDASKHGLVRYRDFELVSLTNGTHSSAAEFRLASDAATRRIFPHDFRVTLRVALDGALRLELVAENTGTTAFPVTEAFHPYLLRSAVDSLADTGSGTYRTWNPDATSHTKTSGLAPDDWKKFLCVENGTFSKDLAYILKPGERHVLTRVLQPK